MKITFFSNYLTHHQIPFSNELYRILGKDYTFITTSDINQWKKDQGWDFESSHPYELNGEMESEDYRTALQLSKESDVIITGSAPEIFVKERMKGTTNGITFRYSERIFKRGRWRCLSPRGILRRVDTYHQYRNRRLYMLCASAYTSGDLLLQGSYIGKCYKWGYFPDTKIYNIDELMRKKVKSKIELLWCGRLINWKHPEVAVKLAQLLKQLEIDFVLNIIGSGEKENTLYTLIKEYQLEGYVHHLGALSPEQVRRCMENADIFLSTSDFQEGWGAVINEAMNSGCAVIASHAVGAVPYLIQDGMNGFIYQNGNMKSLLDKVLLIITNTELRIGMGKNAYSTIINEWNAKNAAERLLQLIDDLQSKGKSDRFQSGPCSKAEIIGNHWFKDCYFKNK